MKTTIARAVRLTVLSTLLFFTASTQAQNEVYDSGTVWTLSTIRIDANMEEEYLKRISKTWKASLEEAKKEKLILSYKVLQGSAANQADYNLLLMVEFSSLASMDPDPAKDAKWKAISDRIEAGPDYEESIKRYGEIRQFFGQKLMREIYLK